MNILITGDYYPCNRVAKKLEEGDWQDIFAEVRPITNEIDLAILNFECPVVENEAKPIAKYGPNSKPNINAVEIIKDSRFGLITLASNHFLDYGETGVRDTLSVLDVNNIKCVGGGINLQEASKIFSHEKEGQTIAIINCYKNEFFIVIDNSAGSNPLNPVKQWYNM